MAIEVETEKPASAGTQTALTPIDKMLRAFPYATGPGENGWYHHADNPRFDFLVQEDGSITINSWTGRSAKDILGMVGLTLADLYHNKRINTAYTQPRIDIVTLAHARGIYYDFLQSLGLSDNYTYRGRKSVRIPYHLPDGTEHTKIKVRKKIDGDYKHGWDEGTPGKPIPYGLDKLWMAREAGELLIGEGESDGWACWLHNVPYLGVPGADHPEKLAQYVPLLQDIPHIYILHEPDQVKKLQETGVGFYKGVYQVLRNHGYMGEISCVQFEKLTECKDPGELHRKLWIADKDQTRDKLSDAFRAHLRRALEQAIESGDEELSREQVIDLCSFDADDSGNGDAMKALYGKEFLWCGARGWFIRTDTDTHWQLDSDGMRVKQKAVETLRLRRHAAVDRKEEAIIKCTKADESRVKACVSRFQTLVCVSIDEFDNYPDMLNCKNGVVDLRTGEIIPHSHEQRFTYCLPVAFEVTDCLEWIDYLNNTIGGGEEVINYLQMALGYSLTGHTREEILFYLYGPTRSGKGTLAETFMALLPTPIATMVDFNSFTAKREGDVSNFDLAPLKPSRLIFASESNRSQALNPSKIKQLTGGDLIRACFKHKDFFAYRPQFKVWMMSNHPVNGDPEDDALWGRVRVIEFPNSFLGKEDKTKKARLKEPEVLQGVLYWAVQGAIKWYALGAQGLTTPEAIKKTTDAQRAELDYIQQWLDACCDDNPDEESWVSNEEVTASYTDWCKNNNVQYPKGPKALSQSLKAKGYVVGKVKWTGEKTKRGVGGLHIYPQDSE